MADASQNAIFGINVLMHVFVLTAFLVVFYKFYVTKLEVSAIHGQIQTVMDSTLPDFFERANTSSGGTFKSAMIKLKSGGVLDRLRTEYAKPDALTVTYNNGLFRSAFIVVFGILALVIVSVFLMSTICGQNIHFYEILRENIVLFSAIGVAEFIFFTHIALHYSPALPSEMNKELIDGLRTKFRS